MHRTWLTQYPAGVAADIGTDSWPSLAALLQQRMRQHRELPACRFMGRDLSYGQLDDLSSALAAYLQSLGLARGDRVAVMLPNVPQYLVAVVAILRAGLVVVNLGTQLQARELGHQLRDSGARALIVIEDLAATVQQVLDAVPARHVVLARLGDLLGAVKGALVNQIVRHVRKQVPAYELPGAVAFNEALARGRRGVLAPAATGPDDIALLQYTAGTSGPSKGAVLLHRNLLAGLAQAEAWLRPALARVPAGEQPVTVAALPLHHAFGFHLILLAGLSGGACLLLIPNPRDLVGTLKALARQRFHCLPAVDTLYAALAGHADFDRVDWSALVLSLAGGMAVQPATARLWLQKTGCAICEGYGLAETGPLATCNRVDAGAFSGHVGLPLPGTEVALLDDDGRPVPPGTAGEIAIRGPQVMAGYWQRPDETARAITTDGYFRSGDIGIMDSRGQLRIVDRKCDRILVSGFNVYPNEVEDVVTRLPGVMECAAVGMRDGQAGEAVKLVVVRADAAAAHPSEDEIRAHCAVHLTGYKRPRVVEFRDALPRTPVGKVLRRELRERA